MKDYYGILGINKSVSSAEIKRAYRRLAMQYHPDKNPSPEAEQFFKEINEAYDILGNEENKRWYDFKLQSHSSSDTTIEFTQPAPRHRDPAYRRKRPVSKPRVETESREELLTRYLPYFFWFNQVGVGLMLIFLLDRSLPLSSSKETVLHLYSVVGKGQIDQGMITTHAYNVTINSDLETFREGDEVELSHTPILKVVYEFRHHGRLFTISDHGIYGAVFIFPIGLFISSMLGLLFRKEPEYAFNLSIISAVLFIFVTIFLLTI